MWRTKEGKLFHSNYLCDIQNTKVIKDSFKYVLVIFYFVGSNSHLSSHHICSQNQILNSSFLAITNKHVKYWTSIITSNVRQINLSNENMKNKHWCFQISKIVSQKNHFGILIYILSWKHLFEIYFRLLKQNIKYWNVNYHAKY